MGKYYYWNYYDKYLCYFSRSPSSELVWRRELRGEQRGCVTKRHLRLSKKPPAISYNNYSFTEKSFDNKNHISWGWQLRKSVNSVIGSDIPPNWLSDQCLHQVKLPYHCRPSFNLVGLVDMNILIILIIFGIIQKGLYDTRIVPPKNKYSYNYEFLIIFSFSISSYEV